MPKKNNGRQHLTTTVDNTARAQQSHTEFCKVNNLVSTTSNANSKTRLLKVMMIISD